MEDSAKSNPIAHTHRLAKELVDRYLEECERNGDWPSHDGPRERRERLIEVARRALGEGALKPLKRYRDFCTARGWHERAHKLDKEVAALEKECS